MQSILQPSVQHNNENTRTVYMRKCQRVREFKLQSYTYFTLIKNNDHSLVVSKTKKEYIQIQEIFMQ